MKTIILLCLCAVAISAPTEERPTRSLPAIEQVDERDDQGQYTLKYVTAEGTVVSETGRLVPTANGQDKVLIYEGRFEYIGDDGKKYVIKYKTDVDGAHQPEGEHLPKPVEAESVPEVKDDLIASA